MSTNSPDPTRSGGLQAMLARLRGMVQSRPPADVNSEDAPKPVAQALTATEEPLPVAIPAEPEPTADDAPEVLPITHKEIELPPAEAAPLTPCPICDTPRGASRTWCDGCGFIFPATPAPSAAAPANAAEAPLNPEPAPAAPSLGRVLDRYELTTLLTDKQGVSRFRGLDWGTTPPTPVTLVRQEVPVMVATLEPEPAEVLPAAALDNDEILPSFDDVLPTASPTSGPVTESMPAAPTWPSVGWETNLLEIVEHPALPRALDQFIDAGFEYLVLEVPQGTSLWDAWDDPDATSQTRFGLLKQVAEALDALHHGGAILEGVRPELVVVDAEGKARLTDLSDLLPLPLPPNAPIRNTLYTAPELTTGSVNAGTRSDLYSLGAMLYALHVGRELDEKDFERPGVPKPFIPRFPDIHPAFGRLISKTFTHDLGWRFPTDEASKEDPSGFTELINTFEVLGRTLDHCRLEIAAWTTTGVIRTGNEDAFALLHTVESRIDDVGESALLLLCDGMGGYEAGEVAAALTIKSLRKNLTSQKPFRALTGAAYFPIEGAPPDPELAEPADLETVKRLLKEALKDANKNVFTASRSGIGRRGMGCTAEVVYLDGGRIVVGHVGDSRTYHLHEGRLIQMTRDQTLVNRLVELGTLTAEEAENHPRKNELQQAIGGQPDVEPGIYSGKLSAGDWVVVCSDGVSNHVNSEQFKQMLQNEAVSADMAARRLVNFVNIEGATDNATIIVVRVV